MPNFKLFGYREEKAIELKKEIKKIFEESPNREEMIITIISSTVELLDDNRKAPYIEIADSNPERGRILLEKLSYGLNEDIELTSINVFVPADEQFVFDRR